MEAALVLAAQDAQLDVKAALVVPLPAAPNVVILAPLVVKGNVNLLVIQVVALLVGLARKQLNIFIDKKEKFI